MKERALPDFARLLLRKRAIVESVIDQLKNISQIEHTRHRSVEIFLLNLVASLTTYALQPKKPAINIQFSSLAVVCFLSRIYVVLGRKNKLFCEV